LLMEYSGLNRTPIPWHHKTPNFTIVFLEHNHNLPVEVRNQKEWAFP
jgi:hypothetical protein